MNAIKGLLERRRRPLAAPSPVIAAARQAREKYDGWIAGKGEVPLRFLANLAGRDPELGAKPFQIRAATFGLRLGSSVAAAGEVVLTTAEDAARLGEQAAAATAFIRTNRFPQALGTLVDLLQISTSGAALTASATLRLDEFEELLMNYP